MIQLHSLIADEAHNIAYQSLVKELKENNFKMEDKLRTLTFDINTKLDALVNERDCRRKVLLDNLIRKKHVFK